MPVTRGRARMMESQEEDLEEEQSQLMQETQDEQDQQTPIAQEAPEVANLKEMAEQLTNTLKHLLTTHRQLENDAAMIQAGMDELYRMQEDRAERIMGRLKNASSTILTFGDRHENEGDDNEDEMMN